MQANLRHYQTLGLTRTDAKPEEIRQGYRRMSLKYHPDRNQNDPDSTKMFQEVSMAYSVLSSPHLRQVYDFYGEQGLKMYENYSSYVRSTEGGAGSPAGPVMMLVVVCFGASLLVLLATALAMLTLLRLNQQIQVPLWLLLSPLWIVEIGPFCCFFAALARGNRSRATGLAVRLVTSACAIVFQGGLCLRADGMQPLSYAVIFIPLFVYETVHATGAALRCKQSNYDTERATRLTFLPYAHHVFRLLAWVTARACFLVALALRLDGILVQCPWRMVMLPLWTALLVEGILSVMLLKSRSECEPSMRQSTITRLVLAIFSSVILLLLCLRLDEVLGSWVPIFAPVFVVGSLFGCICCCFCCIASFRPKPGPQQVPLQDDCSCSTRGGHDDEEAPLLLPEVSPIQNKPQDD